MIIGTTSTAKLIKGVKKSYVEVTSPTDGAILHIYNDGSIAHNGFAFSEEETEGDKEGAGNVDEGEHSGDNENDPTAGQVGGLFDEFWEGV